jgi:chromate reductase
MIIAGISGSLRKNSTHRGILRHVNTILTEKGITFCDVDISGFPLYDQDLNDQGIPAAVQAAHDQLAQADAIVLASPEYNYSVSGVLKNAIDWFSRVEQQAFNGKALSIMGASPGLGTARSQYHLRQILVFMNSVIVNKPEVMIGQASGKFNEQGDLTDDKTKAHIAKALDALIALSQQLAK